MTFKELYYSVVGKRRYISSEIGDTNLIITCPHGGGIKPISIPTRKHGKLLRDSYTKSFTEALIETFDKKPYYVISDIHRSKVDLNRDIVEGTERNKKAMDIWYDWTIALRVYRNQIINLYKNGLLIDIHSNNDSYYIQLGYGISAEKYNRIYYGKKETGSTLDSLGGELSEKLFGPRSIKSCLERAGFSVPIPEDDNVYFNGGRTIEHFSGNGLGCIQIEIPSYLLRSRKQSIVRALHYAISSFRTEFL